MDRWDCALFGLYASGAGWVRGEKRIARRRVRGLFWCLGMLHIRCAGMAGAWHRVVECPGLQQPCVSRLETC